MCPQRSPKNPSDSSYLPPTDTFECLSTLPHSGHSGSDSLWTGADDRSSSSSGSNGVVQRPDATRRFRCTASTGILQPSTTTASEGFHDLRDIAVGLDRSERPDCGRISFINDVSFCGQPRTGSSADELLRRMRFRLSSYACNDTPNVRVYAV